MYVGTDVLVDLLLPSSGLSMLLFLEAVSSPKCCNFSPSVFVVYLRGLESSLALLCEPEISNLLKLFMVLFNDS